MVTYMQTILEFLVLMVPVAFFIVGFAIFFMGGYMTAKTRKIENAIFCLAGMIFIIHAVAITAIFFT